MPLSDDAIDVLYHIRNRGGRIHISYFTKRQRMWQRNITEVLDELEGIVIVRLDNMVESVDPDSVDELLRRKGKLPGHHSEYHHSQT